MFPYGFILNLKRFKSNINGTGRYVFRINHGGQLGPENQIEYEFSGLQALKDSKVTPRPSGENRSR
ncbi:MAG: hypothetical protein ACLFST_09030, partial [Spirochaetia bacterium]